MHRIALVLLLAMLGISAFAAVAVAAVPDECGTPKQTGICIAKVEVGNMYLGARAESPVWIYNGNDLDAQFDVYYKHPDVVQWNYDFPPVEAKQWVTLGGANIGAVETIIVPAHDWASVLVILELPKTLPEDVKVPKRWEFRIRIMERQQSMIVEAYEQRWLIEMAPPGFSMKTVIIATVGALAVGSAIGAYAMRRRTYRQG